MSDAIQEYRCITDGGQCGVGGYCNGCPWKIIAEKDAEIKELKTIISEHENYIDACEEHIGRENV